MGYWTRREALHAAGVGLVGALAGCSALSDPQQSLLVAVNNYTESPHRGHVLIERDDMELVHQYLEVGAAVPDQGRTVETKIALDEMPSGTPLDVTASFGDGLEATGQHTLDCIDQYRGRAIFVNIEPEGPVSVSLTLACYDEFPESEASQDGINQS
jgi:hypothetical protein